MRKLALSSGAYPRLKLVDIVRHAALAGYAAIEVIADGPHGYPPLLTEDDRKAIQAALARSRLGVSNVNTAPMRCLRDEIRPSWIESDRVLRRERMRHTLDAGRLAKSLGAGTLSTLAGGVLEERTTRKQAVRRFVAGLKDVALLVAKGKCPPVLIDAEPGRLVETAAQTQEVLKAVRSPHIAADFNTGHFHRAGEDPAAVVRQLGKSIRHVHLEDVASDGSGEVVVPGTGGVDFAAVFAALDELGYDGWLTVDLSGADVHPDEAAKQALEFLTPFDK